MAILYHKQNEDVMGSEDLKNRTKAFALRIVALVAALPKTMVGDVVGKQILRSGTSVGANYRSASRARSKKEFLSKITVVEEEADETLFWLEILSESRILPPAKLREITREADEITAIFTTIGKETKRNLNNNAKG